MAPKIRHCACRIIPLRSSWPAPLTPSLARSSPLSLSGQVVQVRKRKRGRRAEGGAAVRLDRGREGGRELVAAVPLIFEQQMIGRLVSQWASKENRWGWVGESAKSASYMTTM